MKSSPSLILYAASLLSGVCAASAYTPELYSADILGIMADGLKCEEELVALPDGVNIAAFEHSKKPVTVVKTDGTVSHIGYSVFSADTRRLAPSPFYDAIERYALLADIKMKRVKTVDRELEEEGVKFEYGTLRDLPSFFGNENISFRIENLNGSTFHALWVENGHPACEIFMPYTYEMLRGTTMEENERRILADFGSLGEFEFSDSVATDAPENLIPYFMENYYISPGKSYYLDVFNSNRYYEKSDSCGMRPIYRPEYPRESLANVCLATDVPNRLKINVKLVQYGFNSTNCEIPLTSLVNYFRTRGCTPFFGIIESGDTETVGEVFFRNAELGYCHILKLKAPTEVLGTSEGTISGRLNCYIPISKISSLFNEKGI